MGEGVWVGNRLREGGGGMCVRMGAGVHVGRCGGGVCLWREGGACGEVCVCARGKYARVRGGEGGVFNLTLRQRTHFKTPLFARELVGTVKKEEPNHKHQLGFLVTHFHKASLILARIRMFL